MKLVLLSLSIWVAGASVSAHASSLRIAKSYSCTAYNPATGFASITYKPSKKKSATTAELTYGLVTTPLTDGRLSYDAESPLAFPRAIFTTEVTGTPTTIYMDLLRPISDGKKTVVSGVTYVEANAVVPTLALFASYYGWSYSVGFITVPAGYVVTSVVTCRVNFND